MSAVDELVVPPQVVTASGHTVEVTVSAGQFGTVQVQLTWPAGVKMAGAARQQIVEPVQNVVDATIALLALELEPRISELMQQRKRLRGF